MTIIELGAMASALMALISLTSKIVKLITSIQTLINRIDQLQDDMQNNSRLWHETKNDYQGLNERLSMIEYELAVV